MLLLVTTFRDPVIYLEELILETIRFIGINSIILPGVTIADDCIVGAGSVITKSFVNPGMVIAGNPASVICTVEEARAKNERYALNIGNTSDKKTFLLENEDKFKGYHNCSHEH